jgi:uncharacterized repeat protein (TIGR03803 family)
MSRTLILLFVTALCAPRAFSQNYVTIHDFTGGADGWSPLASLTETSPSLFLGGSSAYLPDAGVIFSISSAGTFTTLYTMQDSTDGGGPVGQLLAAGDGRFYGVTNGGGPDAYGTIFATTVKGRLSVVQASVNIPTPLVEGATGEFYGIDGNYNGTLGTPSFFRMTATGEKTTLTTFPAPASVSGALLQASDGNFYGGSNEFSLPSVVQATLFRLSPEGEYTLLHTFSGTAGVYGNFIQASNGLIYGSTFAGSCDVSRGVIFSLSTAGEFHVIHEFGCSIDGSGVLSGLTEASDGYLYGTCASCGTQMDGGIFKMSLDGSEYTSLATFDGALFYAPGPGMIQGSDGNLYGTAPGGGTYNLGFVFRASVGAPPPLPQLSYARPASAAPGTSVLIHGNNFLATSQVTFNGVPAAFTVRDVAYIEATVPSGATSGTIAVTTPNGTGTSKFSFTIQ